MTEETAQRIAEALEALVALKEREETRDMEHMERGAETLRLNRELKERLDGAVKRSTEESVRAEERAARWEGAASGTLRRVAVEVPVSATVMPARCASCQEVWPMHLADCVAGAAAAVEHSRCPICRCWPEHAPECPRKPHGS